MRLIEFVRNTLKTKVDYDKAFGAQCVDLFRQYCKDVLEIPHTGAVEGAKDLVLKYNSLPLERKYFNLLNPSDSILIGDIIVWGNTATNKYGHVAIALAEIESGILVVEQDGFKQDGVNINIRPKTNVIGILRYKG